jgi:hypothetical protein
MMTDAFRAQGEITRHTDTMGVLWARHAHAVVESHLALLMLLLTLSEESRGGTV